VKIARIRVFEVEGPARSGLALYEIPRGGLAPDESSPYRQRFTQIETDDGVTDMALGGSAETKAFGSHLIGEDPMEVEHIWERLTTRPYNRTQNLSHLSVLDVALWDVMGRAREESVCRLLGGPCQKRIRAYAAMLGFSTDPASAAERSAEWVGKGFTGLKWYLSYNETDGAEGLAQNVSLVKAVRDAVGDDVDLMVDCILSNSAENSLLYAIKLARRLEPYGVTWLEEPLKPEDLDAYEQLTAATTIPLAFGEHMYFRQQFKQAFERGIPTVIQPEMMAAGGITPSNYPMGLLSHPGHGSLRPIT
jgi:L-rhamnonate dehydratase